MGTFDIWETCCEQCHQKQSNKNATILECFPFSPLSPFFCGTLYHPVVYFYFLVRTKYSTMPINFLLFKKAYGILFIWK